MVLAGAEGAGMLAAGVDAGVAVEAAALSFFDFFEDEVDVEEAGVVLAVLLAGVVAAAAFDFLDLDLEVVEVDVEDELAGVVA